MSIDENPIRLWGWFVQYISKDGELRQREGKMGCHSDRIIELYLRRKFEPLASLIETVAVWEADELHLTEDDHILIGDEKDFALKEEPRQVSLYPVIPKPMVHHKPQTYYKFSDLPTYPCFSKLLFPELHKFGDTDKLDPFYGIVPREK